MAERVLTTRELNRALLARQLLLERRQRTPPRALERIGGIQAQYAPAMYVGMHARVDGLRRHALTRALERRRAVQATLMRATIHLVAPSDYWPFALATRAARRALWLRSRPDAMSDRRIAAAARKVRAALADGPLTRAQIEELLGVAGVSGPQGAAVWIGALGQWLDLVRVPPSGTWERRRADIFAAAEDWLGPPPDDLGEEAAVAHLVRSYLRGFGPASRADVSSYTGLTVTALKRPLAALELRRFRDEAGVELLDVPRAALPDADVPAPVRFLPAWDATLLVHARRTRILPEEYRARVFNVGTPNSVNTFLVDGSVAGTWRFADGGIETEPFHRIGAAARRELRAEAERLAELYR